MASGPGADEFVRPEWEVAHADPGGVVHGVGDRRGGADLRRIDAIVADAVPVWGPHSEGM